MPRNVATLADVPSVQRAEITPLTPEQAKQFLDIVQGDRLYALYVVALGLGLRKGEVLGLRWQDVDLERGALTVSSSLQRIDGQPHLVAPKTERSRRTLELPAVVLQALREHRHRQREERIRFADEWQESGLVFTTHIGTALEGRNVTRHFHAALARAGLPRFRFYDMRHSAASFLLAQGVDLKVIMGVLGHSQISLTANLYAHILPSLKKDIAARMDAVLGPLSVK